MRYEESVDLFDLYLRSEVSSTRALTEQPLNPTQNAVASRGHYLHFTVLQAQVLLRY